MNMVKDGLRPQDDGDTGQLEAICPRDQRKVISATDKPAELFQPFWDHLMDGQDKRMVCWSGMVLMGSKAVTETPVAAMKPALADSDEPDPARLQQVRAFNEATLEMQAAKHKVQFPAGASRDTKNTMLARAMGVRKQ